MCSYEAAPACTVGIPAFLPPVQQNEGSIRAWARIFCSVFKTAKGTKSTEGTTALALQNANQNLLLLRTLCISSGFSKANAHITQCPLLPLPVRCVTDVCLHFHLDMHPFFKVSGFLSCWPPGICISQEQLSLGPPTYICTNKADKHIAWPCGCPYDQVTGKLLLLFWSGSLTSNAGHSWEVAWARDDSQGTIWGYFGV